MFERVKQWWAGAFQGKSTPGPETSGGWDFLSGIWQKASSIWSALHSPKELEETYGTQSTVYSCVKKICLSLQEAPLKVAIKNSDGTLQDVAEHPLQTLLTHPNAWMSTAEFLWHAAAHLELTGYCYIWKWRNVAMYVTEMWPVPTSWVRPVIDNNGQFGGYEVWQGGSKPWKFVPKMDMIRIMYPDPSNLTQALGPLQAAMREVQTDSERQDYFIEMLVNSRTPGMILKQPEGWTPEQKDEMRAILSDGLGRGKRGKALFLEGEGAELQQMAPLKDLDWPGLTSLSETRICSAFEIPPILIGLRSGLDSATYSNFETAKRSFYQGTMAPKWAMIGNALTKGFVHDEYNESDLVIYFDISEVRGLRDDEDKTAARAAQIFSSGLGTKNECRQMVGLKPLPPEQGDVFVMPMQMIEVPLGQTAPKPETPPKDDGKQQTEE